MRPSRSSAYRVAQLLFAAAVIVAVVIALRSQWDKVELAARTAHPRWGIILASGTLVLLDYAILVEAWRTVLAGWGGRLRFWDAARIWSISNLGRYIPGKVWQMGSMAVMAQQRGVSGVAAAGSALIVTLVNTVAGFVVVLGTGARVLDVPAAGVVTIGIVAAGVIALPYVLPWLGRVAGAMARREIAIARLPHRAIWIAAAISAVAWIVYGVAFRLLASGVLGRATGAPSLYVAVFTGSYLAGFLALPAPGGVGVREWVMWKALTEAGMSSGDAILLVVASRLWLTILEIVPALLFLAHRWVRPQRPDGSNPTTAISAP